MSEVNSDNGPAIIDNQPPKNVHKPHKPHRCGKCGLLGHNLRTCKKDEPLAQVLDSGAQMANAECAIRQSITNGTIFRVALQHPEEGDASMLLRIQDQRAAREFALSIPEAEKLWGLLQWALRLHISQRQERAEAAK